MGKELQRAAAQAWLDERLSETTPEEMMAWSVRQLQFGFEDRIAELQSAISAEVKRREEDNLRPPSLLEAGRGISKAERDAIELQVEKFRTATKVKYEYAAEQLAQLSVVDVEDSKSLPAPPPELVSQFAFLTLGSANFESLVDEYLGDFNDSGRHYAEAYLNWKTSPGAPNVLFDALLPAAIAEFEALLAGLLRIALLVHPRAMSMDNKQVSLGEVRAAQHVAVIEIIVMVRS